MKNKKKKNQIFKIDFDTKVSVIEEKYGISFGVRSDKKLGIFLKETGYPSLAEMLQGA